MWTWIVVVIFLLALVIIVEAKRDDNNVAQFKHQNSLANAVLVIVLIVYSCLCIHADMLLTNSRVRQVHTLQVFGSITVKALVQANAIFGLLSAICLIMFELTSQHLSAQLFFLDLSFAVTFV